MVAQESVTSVAFGYQATYFKFRPFYDYSYSQDPLKSYGLNASINHTFKINLGLEFQVGYGSDRFKEITNSYLPLPYDIKEIEYQFDYFTITQGINYNIKLNKKFRFIIQANLTFKNPVKKTRELNRYNGDVTGWGSLSETDDKNGIVISSEMELALKYQIMKKAYLQLDSKYASFHYAKNYAIDAQIHSAYAIELIIGYSF